MDVEELERNIRKDFSTVQNDMLNLKKDVDNVMGIVKGISGEFEIVKKNINNIIDVIEKRAQEEQGPKEELGEDFQEIEAPPEGAKSEGAPEVEPDIATTQEDILLEDGPPEGEEEESSEEEGDEGEGELDVPPERPTPRRPVKKKAVKKTPGTSFYQSIKGKRK